ncbi:MAG TPA: prephenate dehydratase [Nakamurella sp.]
MTRVDHHWAYLGPEGTFTEQAARSLVQSAASDPGGAAAASITLAPVAGVSVALAAVRSGEAAAAVVPLESSVEGAVPLTQDELTHGEPLMITAEAYVPVTFDLLVRPGTSRAQVRSVGAHPHGHAQIRPWLADNLPDAEVVMSASNAAAAAAVAQGSLDAAAAAPVAGPRYGLESLATDIGEVRDAVTRFVLLTKPGAAPPPTGNDRTSLVLSVDNHPGSLLAALTEFASRGINLTRLESRPTRSKMGEYVFLVDADGHLRDEAMADVLAALIRRSVLHRWLGSYPRIDGKNDPAARYATPESYLRASDRVRQWQRGDWA